ncbi:MAG: folate family ECF transporter S component [Clostridia bacterium]
MSKNDAQSYQEVLDKSIVECGVLQDRKSVFSTRKIAYIAMFVAINVVIGAFSPRIGTLKVTLTYTMCFLAGYFFGGVAGVVVGGMGDLLGSLLGGFAPNPIILLSSCLLGFLPALARKIEIKALKEFSPYFQILISYILCFVICTMFVNTYGLYIIGLAKGKSFWAYVVVRMATQSPIIIGNLMLTFALYPIFSKIFNLSVKKF